MPFFVVSGIYSDKLYGNGRDDDKLRTEAL